jgi:RNA polymerase sigma-70 factor, ECF subfamily
LAAPQHEQPHLEGFEGDERVDFDALYRESATKVARWAARLGGPFVDPADIVQEVFIIAYRRRSTLSVGVKPTTWLFGITSHVVQAHLRKQRARQWFFRQNAEARQMAFGPTPMENLEQRRAEAKAYRILDQMAPKHRNAFILFELEGMSTQQIAELLGVNLGTVKVWLHRARTQFIKRLANAEIRGEAKP